MEGVQSHEISQSCEKKKIWNIKRSYTFKGPTVE